MYPFIPTLTSDMRLATCQLQRPQRRYLPCRLRIHRLPIMAIRRDRDQLHALHYQPKKPTSVLSLSYGANYSRLYKSKTLAILRQLYI